MGQRGGMMGGNMMGRGGPPGGMMRGPPPGMGKAHIQGCGNIMLDLSELVPFHSGQVENFYLLVLGQVQMCKVNTILYIIF